MQAQPESTVTQRELELHLQALSIKIDAQAHIISTLTKTVDRLDQSLRDFQDKSQRQMFAIILALVSGGGVGAIVTKLLV